MEQPKKELYKKLSADGVYTKSYEEFEQQFNSPEKQEALYQKLNADGKYTKSKDEFVSRFFSVKKKDGANASSSSSTVQKPTLDLETPKENGSSGTPPIKILKKDEKIFTDKNTPSEKTIPKVSPLPQNLKKVITNPENVANFENKKKEELIKFRNSTQVDEIDQIEIQKDLEAKKTNTGVINKIKSGFSSLGDYFTSGGIFGSGDLLRYEKKEAKNTLVKQGIKNPTQEQVDKLADEIYIQKQTDIKRQDKTNEYLSNLDPLTKNLLENDAEEKFQSTSKLTKDITNRISANEKVGLEYVKELESGDLPEQEQELLKQEIIKIAKQIDADQKIYISKFDELGTYADEFNAFKRNYDAVSNFSGRAYQSIANAGIGFIEGLEFIGTLGNPDPQVLEDTNKMRQEVSKVSEKLRPELQEITADNFMSYASDLLANQSGTLLAIGTTGGVGGATILGVGGAGEKYSEMYQENKKGAKFTPLQMATASLASGVSTAIFSELPTAKTLLSTKRIFMSAINDGKKEMIDQAVKGTSSKILQELSKNYKREISTELMDNLVQNAIDKDILGRKDVGYFDNSLKVLQDTALMTTMFSSGALPHVVVSGVKMFTKKGEAKILDENSKKIIELSKELSNENLDDVSRKVIEKEIDKATLESETIVTSTLEKMSNLDESEVKQVVENTKKSEELKEQAKAINDNESIEPKRKEVLLDGLKNEFIEIQKQSDEIITKEPIAVAETTTSTPTSTEVATPSVQQESKVEPIRQLGNGANIYFETEKYRVNDFGKDKTLLNIGDKNGNLPLANIEFNNPEEAVFIAKKLQENAPDGLVEGFHNVDNIVKNLKEQYKNETAQTNNTPANGDVSTRTEPNVSQGENNALQPTFDARTSESKVEVKKEPTLEDISTFLTEKFKQNEPTTEAKTNTPTEGNGLQENITVPQEQKVKKLSRRGKTPLDKRKIKDVEMISALNIEAYDPYSLVQKYFISGGRVLTDDVKKLFNSGEEARLRQQYARTKENKGATINGIANSLWEEYGESLNLDTEDFKNAIEEVISSFLSPKSMAVDLNSRFGIKYDPQNIEFDQDYEALKSLNIASQEEHNLAISYLDVLTDEEIIKLAEEQADFEEFLATEEGNKSVSEKQQRKDKANAEVDKIADKIKKALPGIKDPDVKAQGLSQDAIIDLVASAVKNLVNSGIEIEDAIRQVVKSLKERFGDLGFEIDTDKVKAIVSPKSEDVSADVSEFVREAGKKSLLSRIAEGTSGIVKEAIKGISLNYDVQKIDDAKKIAKEIVEKLGVEESIIALSDKNSDLEGAVRAFVFQNVSKSLENSIEEMQNNGLDAEKFTQFDALNQALAKIKEEMDFTARDAGRFINALQYIYEGSEGEYALRKKIQQYEAINGEAIPDDVLAKFSDASQKQQELEKRVFELIQENEKLQAQLALDDIIEDSNQKPKQKKKIEFSEDKKKEKDRLKKEIFKDYFGTFNDVTRFAQLLADPRVIKYLKLTFEETGGDFINFSNEIAESFGKGIKKYTKDLYVKAGGKESDAISYRNSPIKIDKEGKVIIPKSTLLRLIEEGYTEIDSLSEQILKIVNEEYPDTNYNIRDIRDSITDYGKIIKPTEDEILILLGRARRLGRLISQLEDVKSGKRPKKSGLQREKPLDQERRLKREVDDILRDMRFTPTDAELEIFIKSQNDKIKTRLENEIRDLDAQILVGEKRKIEKQPIEYTDKNKRLKETRDAKKELLDSIVGKPEMTEEQKIKKAEILLERSIEKIKNEILNNEIEFSKKRTLIVSEKLTELREKRKQLSIEKQKLQQEAGIIDKRRLENAKKYASQRIQELKTRIENKDFSKKERKPLPADAELNEIQIQLEEIRNIYDSELYKDELSKQSKWKKIGKNIVLGLVNLPRTMLASFEFSFVFIQNGFLTVSGLVDDIIKIPATIKSIYRNQGQIPIDQNNNVIKALIRQAKIAKLSMAENKMKTANNLVKMFSAMGSNTAIETTQKELVRHPYYNIAKKAGLELTFTDGKMEVKQEAFIHDIVCFALDTPGYILQYATKDKKYTPIGRKIVNIFRKQIGVAEIQGEKKTALEQVKAINIQRVVERGMVSYANTLMMENFTKGATLLESQGKSITENKDDFKQLANAINNMSGRSSLFLPFIKVGVSKSNYLKLDPTLSSILFFSYKLASSHLNRFNPFWIYSLRDKDTAWYKPSYSQKLLLRSYAKYYVFASGLTLLYSAMIAGEDEDEDSIYKVGYIETDVRSSNFMKVYQGKGVWIDFFCGTLQAIPLLSRQFSGEVKTVTSGEVKKMGEGMTGTRFDYLQMYGANKLSPSARVVYDFTNAKIQIDKETGEEKKIVGYDKEEFDIKKRVFMNIPMTFETMAKMSDLEGDRELYNEALYMSMMFGYPNVQVFDKKEENGSSKPSKPSVPSGF